MRKAILLFLVLSTSPVFAADAFRLDLVEIFNSSPVIYALLAALSLFSSVIWIYSLVSLKLSTVMPPSFIHRVTKLLREKKYDNALEICGEERLPCASILSCALHARRHGHQVMREAMQTEGKRCGVGLWQRISLLNDVAVIAPMLGLLGTVLGLFYAFYDVNRSPDTLASIFDGLGIAVGTTVAGLIVAILSMLYHASLKFRIVRVLNRLENETLLLGNLIEES